VEKPECLISDHPDRRISAARTPFDHRMIGAITRLPRDTLKLAASPLGIFGRSYTHSITSRRSGDTIGTCQPAACRIIFLNRGTCLGERAPCTCRDSPGHLLTGCSRLGSLRFGVLRLASGDETAGCEHPLVLIRSIIPRCYRIVYFAGFITDLVSFVLFS